MAKVDQLIQPSVFASQQQPPATPLGSADLGPQDMATDPEIIVIEQQVDNAKGIAAALDGRRAQARHRRSKRSSAADKAAQEAIDQAQKKTLWLLLWLPVLLPGPLVLLAPMAPLVPLALKE